jgi:putative membrane protein
MQLLFKPLEINEKSIEVDEKPLEVDTKARRRRNSLRVRDHLANERTYLAWMRSAIALMGFGFVIVRLSAFHSIVLTSLANSWKLGLIFSLVGLLTVLLSTGHYFAIRYDLDEDVYEPPDRWVILFSLVVILLGAGVIYCIFTAPFNSLSGVVFE